MIDTLETFVQAEAEEKPAVDYTEATWDPRPWVERAARLERAGIGKMPPADGPWWSEPDESLWIDPDTGYACAARRGPWGAWCGYVEVPKGHTLHGVDYNGEWSDPDRAGPESYFDVHGGITFAGSLSERSGGPASDDWWFGFDCGHAGDIQPGMPGIGLVPFFGPDVYRTLTYVKQEVTHLARQLRILQ